jgi:subtilisin
LDGALAQDASPRGRYIVVLQDTADPAGVAVEHERRHGAKHDLVFRHALKGYAAELSEGAAQALRSDPRVVSVEPDGGARLAQAAPCGDPPCNLVRRSATPSTASMATSAALVRATVGAGFRSTWPCSTAASISTIPISTSSGGKDCFASGSFDDRDGHVCGIDFVTATRTDADPRNDIAVANLSLGGPIDEQPDEDCASTRFAVRLAVCRAVRAGAVVVASAGDDGVDLAGEFPAAYEEVLTVTAMADFDGQPGGLQPPSAACVESLGGEAEEDDSAAFFSNFATLAEDQAHTVSAPGVCVNSTFPGGQYATLSGTSFSAPVAAGTVALCLHTACQGMAPRQVIRKIVADARAYNRANRGYGYDGDPLRPFSGRYYGWLIRAGLY